MTTAPSKVIYVDNNATTPVAPEVAEAIQPYLGALYFNPSSAYEQARQVSDVIKAARQTVASFLGGVDPGEILFTSCATESNNTAIFGALQANPQRRHIVTTAVEHPSVLEVCKEAQRRGCEVTFLPVNRRGELSTSEFIKALRPDTLMVSIMHANNETGVVFPIAELARLAKETDPDIIFHTDATQSVGKLAVQLRGNFRNVDLLSFSGHKLHAPKGIGALYVRKGTPLRTYLIGGHQESNRRGGTENVAFIAGLARACVLAADNQAEEVTGLADLRDRLREGLCSQIPYLEVNGEGAELLPNTLNISVHYIEGEGMLFQLNSHGICASSGSACTSGSLDPSHVLKAMHVPFTAVHGSVRFSLSRYNTVAEIDYVIKVFPEMVRNLRRLSPYWDNDQSRPRPNAPQELA